MDKRQKKKSSQSNAKAFWYLEAKGNEDANSMPECRCNLILPFSETKDIWSHTEETWDPKLTRGINPIQMGPGKSSQVSCLWCFQVCLLRLSTLSYRFWAYLQKNIQNRKTKHKYRKLTSWLKVLQSGGPSGLEDPGEPLNVMTRVTESPQKTRRLSSMCKKQRAFIVFQVLTGTLGLPVYPMHWHVQRAPSSAGVVIL